MERTQKKPNLIIGLDGYNQSLTWGVSMALRSVSTDTDHIPLVIIGVQDDSSNERIRWNDIRNRNIPNP